MAEQATKRERPTRDEAYVLMSDEWRAQKEAAYFDRFARVVRRDLLLKNPNPTEEMLAEPNNSAYVCLFPKALRGNDLVVPTEAQAAGMAVCGAWIAGSARNRGVLRHMETIHNHKEAVANEKDATSQREMVKGVLLSSLAVSPFTSANGPLRMHGVVNKNMPSKNTFHRHACGLLSSLVANLMEDLSGPGRRSRRSGTRPTGAAPSS
jgi:hypothetical protein